MTAVNGTASVQVDPALIPGGLEVYLTREIGSGLIEFEFAPAGYLTKKGEVRKADWRAYFWSPTDGKRTRLPSVTTLLGAVLPKDLTRWGEEHGIRGAMEAIRRGELRPEADDAFAVDTVRALKLGSDAARDRRAVEGTDSHKVVEAYLRTGEPPNPADWPPEIGGYITALTRWLLKADPEPVDVEHLVADAEEGYAGRVDLRARIDGRLLTVDFKTNPRGQLYSSAHVQTAMYERAAVACGDEPADGCLLVVFAEDGSFREMECMAAPAAVDAALAWYQTLKPIESACQSHNRVERKAREAAA